MEWLELSSVMRTTRKRRQKELFMEVERKDVCRLNQESRLALSKGNHHLLLQLIGGGGRDSWEARGAGERRHFFETERGGKRARSGSYLTKEKKGGRVALFQKCSFL